jgi:enoyl-CoA hydratase
VIWPLLVGPNRAKELLMLGRLISGVEAKAMGLFSHAAPAGEVLQRARALAEEYAALPPLAVQWTKMSVNRVLKAQLETVLDASIALEMMSMNTRDHAEATKAFVEKRPPTFEGR